MVSNVKVGTASYFLVELLVKKSTLSVSAKIKGEDERAAAKFAEYFQAQLNAVMP